MKVAGKKYAEADEKYSKRNYTRSFKEAKTAGIASELKESEKQMGYSKLPRMKGQKKKRPITDKQGKVI